MSLELYQARVVIERDELDAKMEKLLAFNRSAAFSVVTPAQQTLLLQQYNAMSAYLTILDERIKEWGL